MAGLFRRPPHPQYRRRSWYNPGPSGGTGSFAAESQILKTISTVDRQESTFAGSLSVAFGKATTYQRWAQFFVPGATGLATSFRYALSKNNAPTDDVIVEL